METPTTTERPAPTCWICGAPLKVGLTRNKHEKVALTLWCSTDGRHWRAFCNHRPTVEEVVARLEAQAANGAEILPASDEAEKGLQNDDSAPVVTLGRTRTRRRA